MHNHVMKIKKRGKDGWDEDIETSDSEHFKKEFTRICKKHENDTGSFYLSYKVNGGAGKNPKTGATMVFHWKNKFTMIHSVFKGV